MTWSPVTMRWPTESTRWMDQLSGAKALADRELASTGTRLADLEAVTTTNPGPVGAAAKGPSEAGRQAMAEQLSEPPACLVVTPFQSGIGQGRGHQRFLSAPNLLQALANKLTDATDAARPQGEQHALCILFLATRYDQLAASLGRFNALMPVPELVRAERRADHLAKLEAEKWQIPQSGPLPRWQPLPLERCTVVKAALRSEIQTQHSAPEVLQRRTPVFTPITLPPVVFVLHHVLKVAPRNSGGMLAEHHREHAVLPNPSLEHHVHGRAVVRCLGQDGATFA